MQSLEYDIGFSDSEVLGYHRNGDTTTVFLRAWNEKTLVFDFHCVASFIDRGAWSIADVVCEDQETPLLREALKRLYDEAPAEHNLKHFCFFDLDDQPCIEVIAESCSISTES